MLYGELREEWPHLVAAQQGHVDVAAAGALQGALVVLAYSCQLVWLQRRASHAHPAPTACLRLCVQDGRHPVVKVRSQCFEPANGSVLQDVKPQKCLAWQPWRPPPCSASCFATCFGPYQSGFARPGLVCVSIPR